ncbi:uncharacterized protein [Argopecten irradians]|uniref:uncharacterized protein isoform X2 n=1 Tax=Argopecten irradians TaxID=31199 RepID=UPI003719A53C
MNLLKSFTVIRLIKRMTSTNVHGKTKTGFVDGKNYDQGRPSYTEKAVSYIADIIKDGSRSKSGNISYDVVELGAGTGKFTQKIINNLPQTVVAAQCFHWFASDESLTEIHRVLVPGGKFVMVWNNKDWSVPWVKDIETILTGYYGDTPRAVNRTWKTVIEKFSGFQCKEHIFQDGIEFKGDREFVVGHFCTISIIASLPDDEKEAVRRRMYQVLDSHDETRNQDIIRIPFQTELYHSVKL